MLGNETLREAFAVGVPNAEIARAYLDWLRTIRRRTRLTVYQYAAKLQSFTEWIDSTPLDAVSVETIEALLDRPRAGMPDQVSQRGMWAWNHAEADVGPETRLVVTEDARGLQEARACCGVCYASVLRYVAHAPDENAG